MALDVKVLALSKGYTDESIAGGGISAGKNCTIQSITPIPATEVRPAGQRVTFAWYLDNGTAQTSVMNVYNGADGEDGQGIDRMYVNAEGHLVVVYDNGTEEDVGEITIPDFQADWDEIDPEENSFIKNKPLLGTASGMDIPESGDASNGQVVLGNDSRLTNARNAADVYNWAKAENPPTYTKSDVGLGNVDNTSDANKPVSTAQQTALDAKTDLTNISDVEATTTASKSYAANTYLIYSGVLYKVSTAIAQGGEIVTSGVGKNVDAVKVMNEIGSGGGGTSDYTQLTNKPQINDVTLTGNKSLSDLGFGTAAVKNAPASGDAGNAEVVLGNDSRLTDSRTPTSHQHTLSDITDAGTAAAKDSTNAVTQSSTDLVESGAVYTALSGKANTSDLGTAAAKDSTNAVTANSTDLVESGAVKAAIDNAVASVYEPGGSKTCAELVSGLLVVANKGKVYNVTDSGTTTADFVEGAGEPIYAGEDVAIINIGTDANPVYKFNKMGGKVDLSNYYNKTDSDTHYLKKDGASGNYQTVNGSVAVQGEVWARDNIALSNVAESLAYFNSGIKADKLYNIGDRFVYQGILLEAIQTINGNSDIVITEGVTQNAKKVTLDEVIEDVASDIPDVSGKTNLTVIAGVEATTIASKAYAVGDRLVYNGKLYSVTSSIIDGGSIIIEGASANVVETTVDEAINSGSSKVYKHFNITAKSGSIIKLSGFGAFDNDSLGETLLLREKGGETILFAYGSYYGDVNEDSNYIARRFSENATNYITSIVVNKANRDIYVTVASGGDLDVVQIGGIRRDFAYEKNATIPSSNTQTVTIKDVAVGSISGKADKVQSATNGNFAGLDSNGNLTDSGKNVSDLDDKCDLTNIAKVFTTSDTFSVGDWVFYEGRLYRCTTLHQGAWNSSHFSARRVDQLIPDDVLSLYGNRSSISMRGTSPGKSSISAGGYSFSAFEFDTEYTVFGNEYALYNGLRYIDFDVIMGNDVYRNYKYYDASPYEAEYQSLNEPSYPFFFVVIDPEGYPFAIKMYDINLAAGTFKMKISYLNGYYRGAGEIYLAINTFEKA